MLRKDQSFGIIPIRPVDRTFQVLLIQQKKGGHWGFPKGHPELGESPEQTAARELKEETGITKIRLIPHKEVLQETYTFSKEGVLTEKTVRYFLAEVLGDAIELQAEEIVSFQWVYIEEADQLITYPESRTLSKKAAAILVDLYGYSV